jgi:1-acyl-sn-glycerol-3-phosphate acyltransferase
MKRALCRSWRLCATGLCFVTFMMGSLVLTGLVFPLLACLPISKQRQQRWILLVTHWVLKLFMHYMQWLSPIAAFDVIGRHHIDPGTSYLFIANHPTLIDIVAIISCLPFCACIVKKALQKHFYMGGVVRAAGYIVNDTSQQLIAACERCFKEKRSLLIFPEGTRSPAYGLHPFNRGAAHIALRTGIQVVPIVITYNNPTLLKGEAWFRIPEHPLRLQLHFHPPMIFPKAIQEEKRLPLQVRALTRYFEDFFRRELRCHRIRQDAEAIRYVERTG